MNQHQEKPAHRQSLIRSIRWFTPALLAIGVIAACGGDGQGFTSAPEGSFLPPELPSGWIDNKIQYANRDMVAAANPLAVNAGVAVLARGGTAVDAAIAVQMVLNLVEPQSSGVGGGAFMVHFDKATNTVTTYDGRETAPAAATANQFLTAAGAPLGFLAAVDGGLSVGTPGLVRMLELAHKNHGKLAWSSLFDEGIRLSEAGFNISARMNTQVVGAAARLRAQGEPAASYFLKPDGTAKDVGTLLRNPELADTFRKLAAGGANAFYTGEIAQSIVDKVRSHPTQPGRLSMADMAGYQAKNRPAVCGEYRALKVCGMGPPSSGGITVLQTLGILENFNVRSMKPNTADSVHLISEAYRLAYADRGLYIADSDFVSVPTAGLINKDYLKARASIIKMDKSMGAPTPGTPPGAVARGIDTSLSLPSTSHMSIVDSFGNVVSMTTTIENGFGSLQMVRGFLLNNQLTDFSFAPTDAAGKPIANAVAPGKRPRSSMSPTIVLNAANEVEAIIGSPGGSNIIQYVVKSLVGVVDWDLNIQQAINLPNFGAQTSATTSLERLTTITALEADLKARGHTVSIADINSGLHGIVFNGRRANGQAGTLARDPNAGTWAGGADPRREGVAKGNN
jgi:gamma-glutamyltranspeptidase/glutathione hydrolase